MSGGEGGYSVGSAFLQILPSFKGIAQQIEAEAAKWGQSAGRKFSDTFNDEVRRRTNNAPLGPSDGDSTKQGTRSGGKFADGFKAKVEAALRNLPDIDIDANTSEADRKIAELRGQLQELADKRVGVDISDEDAKAELERIKAELDELGAKSPSVRVKADTAAASAKLAELQAEIAAINGENVEVDADDGGSAARTASGISLITAAVLALFPLLGPLAGALAAVGAGFASTMGAVVGAAGVAYLGLSGVSKAMGLLDKQQQQVGGSGGSVVNTLNQQADAADRVKNARQSLAEALRDQTAQERQSAQQIAQAEQSLANARQEAADRAAQAARQVQDAEYSLQQTVQRSADAQQALNDAREQAARDLETYADNAVDANLGLQQSQIDLTNAQARYQQDLADPTVTPLQLQQDALNVAKAQQAVVEAQQRLQQATEDNTKAQAEGVDGAPGVVSAAQAVAQAQHDEQQAVQALADAQKTQAEQAKQSAQQIAQAEQSLSNARLAMHKQELDSADRVAQAERSLASATRAQAAAGASSGGGGGFASIGAQLATINPAVLAFATFLHDKIVPALDKVKGAAAAGLLPGLQRGLTLLLPVLPPLIAFVSSLAKTMGSLFVQAVKALGDPVWQRFFGYVAKNAGPILTTFAKIVGNLAKAFAGFLTAFGPISKAIGDAILRWAQGLTGQDGLGRFVDFVKRTGPVIATMLSSWATVFGHLVSAFAPLGVAIATLLASIGQLLAKLGPNGLLAVVGLLAAAVLALGFVFDAIPLSIAAVGVAVAAAVGLIVSNWSTIQPVVKPVLDLFQEIWGFITNTLVPVLVGIFQQALAGIVSAFHTVSDAVSGHKKQLGELKDAFAAVVRFITTKVLPLLGPLLKGAFELAGQSTRLFIDVVAGLVEGFHDAVRVGKNIGQWFSTDFVDFWKKAARGVKDAFSGVAGFLSGVWSDVERVFADGVNFVTQDILNPVIRAINSVLGVFGVHIGTIGKITVGTSNDKGPGSRGGGQNAPRAYSLGGVAPGYSPGNDTLLARVSPGEGFIVPEAVRGLGGPSAIHAINSMFSSRVPGFSLGGVLGGIGGAIGGAVGAVVGKARELAAAAALKTLEALEIPIRAALSFAPSGFARTLGGGALNTINTDVHNYIAGKKYDNGGYLPPGLTAVWNGTGAPEPVFTPSQLASLGSGASLGDITVYAQFGEETVKAQAIRVVQAAAQRTYDLERAGVGGTTTAQRLWKVTR